MIKSVSLIERALISFPIPSWKSVFWDILYLYQIERFKLTIYECFMYSKSTHFKKNPIDIVFHAKPVRLIETCTFSCLQIRMRSYCTFNRIITKPVQTVRLIELYAKQKPKSRPKWRATLLKPLPAWFQ